MHQTRKSVAFVDKSSVCCMLFLLTERAKKGWTGNESNIFVKLIFFGCTTHNNKTHTCV